MSKTKKRKHSRSSSRENGKRRSSANGKLQKMQDQLDNLTSVITTLVQERKTHTVLSRSDRSRSLESNTGTL